ncbi:hypothetical protein CPT_Scapp_009 [Serratia phage Scapp]|uniref:Uncharacterized protein n=1 Tax=Serratia phage Scapp TaxID=2282409 RepID=A0A345L6N6_9CAUD|nr:hypothetical protein PP898_gp09 [Serratia phage Scapp]AXH50938.1 hypothetical protein CPT_Scapp_009 [Serratia phage Scapp]
MACKCKVKRRDNWRIIDYRCNYSAFNGYRYTPSDYSSITCLKCGSVWRSKSSYVDTLQARL